MQKETLKKALCVGLRIFDRFFDPLYRAFCIVLSHIVLIAVGFCIGALMMSNYCHAKVVYYGSEMETVTVAYGGPTIFRFNDEVKTISQASNFSILPADQATPNYTTLSVTPRFVSGSSKVTFILSNGAVVSTNIVIVSKALPEKTDSFYDFNPKESLVEHDENDKGQSISDLELMKAMIRFEQVVGYNTRSLIRTVDTGVDNLKAQLVQIYTGPKFNGYVFKITNESNSKSYSFEVKNLSLGTPNQALLSQVDKKVLEKSSSGNNSTYLRIVAKPTSIYYNINLPVSAVVAK